jgi:hypothetical protein
MTSEEKLDKISSIQQEISINRTRLENAEQSVQLYLEKLEELNQRLFDILNNA